VSVLLIQGLVALVHLTLAAATAGIILGMLAPPSPTAGGRGVSVANAAFALAVAVAVVGLGIVWPVVSLALAAVLVTLFGPRRDAVADPRLPRLIAALALAGAVASAMLAIPRRRLSTCRRRPRVQPVPPVPERIA
jgi:hypothetical protein